MVDVPSAGGATEQASLGVHLCEQCGQEPGRPYQFIYGTQRFETGTSGTSVTHRTVWEQKGEQTAYLGDACVGQYRQGRRVVLLAVAWMFVAFSVVGVVLAVMSGWGWVFLGVFSGLCAAGAWASTLDDPGAQREAGETLAIRLHLERLRDQGYVCWTHDAWRTGPPA